MLLVVLVMKNFLFAISTTLSAIDMSELRSVPIPFSNLNSSIGWKNHFYIEVEELELYDFAFSASLGYIAYRIEHIIMLLTAIDFPFLRREDGWAKHFYILYIINFITLIPCVNSVALISDRARPKLAIWFSILTFKKIPNFQIFAINKTIPY